MIKALNAIEVITFFVEDLANSTNFYLSVFNGEVVYQDEVSWVLKLDNLMINLLKREEASALVEPGMVAPPGTGHRMMLTVRVDSVDAVIEALTKQGVTILTGPTNQSWGRRTATFEDPAGNLWEIAQTEGF